MQYNYSSLNIKYTKNLWQKLGIQRRSGILCPLFSIYSETSIGIGEFRDLLHVIDWCKKTGNTILELLPLNEAGYGNSPYSAHSSFAMDPVYLSIEEITTDYKTELENLRNKYPTKTTNINYEIRQKKLQLLKKIFKTADLTNEKYKNFKTTNKYWLEDYANYKDKKNREFYKWIQWHTFKQMKKVTDYARKNSIKIMGDIPFLVAEDSADVKVGYKENFNLDKFAGCPPDATNALGQKWGMPTYNWQKLKETDYKYFKDKLKYAENFFDMYRIDHVAGMFRLWTISKNDPEGEGGANGYFDPIDKKDWKINGKSILKAMIDSSSMLPCAEDLGVVPDECTETLNELGIAGMDVLRWLKNRDKEPRKFIKPENYRKIACALNGTHDTSNTLAMWLYEINTTDEWRFKKECYEKKINFDEIAPKLFDLENSKFGRLRWKEDVTTEAIFLWNLRKPKDDVSDLLEAFLETHNEDKLLFSDCTNSPNFGCKDKFSMQELNAQQHIENNKEKNTREIVYDLLKYISNAASIFCIHSILDIMLLEFKIQDIWSFRFNFPGSTGDHNWSIRIPCKVEDWKNMKINAKIFELNKKTGRI